MPFSRPSRPSRQSTAHSGRSERGLLRALSLIKQRQTEEDQPAPGALKERFFSKYNLSWTKLSQFLENRFPELKGTFEERISNNDYVFKLPRPLTELETLQIEELRDQHQRDPNRREESVEV